MMNKQYATEEAICCCPRHTNCSIITDSIDQADTDTNGGDFSPGRQQDSLNGHPVAIMPVNINISRYIQTQDSNV